MDDHVVACPTCHTLNVQYVYIESHNVLHCICDQCGREWVE